MDLGSILLVVALLILVVIFVMRPFLEKESSLIEKIDTDVDQKLSFLLAERDRIINALQELDFDAALGKIPAEEYPVQRKLLMQRGADVLRQIDSILNNHLFDQNASEKTEVSIQPDTVEDRIEAAVLARRADAGSKVISNQVEYSSLEENHREESKLNAINPEDDIETLLANRRRVRNGKASGFCPQCGGPTQQTDRFCPKCGKGLA